MQYNINIINSLIAAGIFQCFIISLALCLRKVNRPYSNRILAIFLMVIQLHLSYLILIDFNITAHYSWLLWIPWNYTSAIGPLFYLYSKSKTDIKFIPSKGDFRLFIPTIIEIGLHIIQLIYCIEYGIQYYRSPLFVPLYSMTYLWAGTSIYFYSKKSLKLIKNHENRVLGHYSNLKNITLSWLSKFIDLYRWIWVCWVPFIIILLFSFEFNIGNIYLAIAMYTLILGVTYISYFLGLEGLIHSQSDNKVDSFFSYKNKGYANLPKDRVQELISKILESMKIEQQFKDDQISLSSLATYLNEEPNLVSYILNTHLKKNFHDFINHFRVEEVKRKIIDPEFAQYKIVSIAYDSGFNSKATFNRVFKKHAGESPSQYLRRNRI